MKFFRVFCVCLPVLFCTGADWRVGDPDPKCCHTLTTPVADDPELLNRVQQLIMQLRLQQDELPPCVEVRKIERENVMLIAQHGHDELAHWLEHDPNGLLSTLCSGGQFGALFSNPATREHERKEVRFLFFLVQDLRRISGVRSITWWEMDFQKAFCPICNPARRSQWRPQYRFQYPSHLTTEEFLEMLTALDIELAMPIRGSEKFQLLPPHGYAQEVTIIDPGPRIIKRKLVWHPVYREGSLGELSLEVKLGEAAYAPSRAILDWCGMWGSDHTEPRIYHLYSKEMADCFGTHWKQRWFQDQQNLPNLRGTPLREVVFGFRKRTDGRWEIYISGLRYY